MEIPTKIDPWAARRIRKWREKNPSINLGEVISRLDELEDLSLLARLQDRAGAYRQAIEFVRVFGLDNV